MNQRLLIAAAVIAAGVTGMWLIPDPAPAPAPVIVAQPSDSPVPTPTAPSSPLPLALRSPTPTPTPTPTPAPTKALPPPPPVDAKSALHGLGTRELTAADRTELKLPEKLWGGVVVTDVDPTSPAAEARLAPGDVLFRAGGNKIMSWDDLARAIGDREQTRVQAYRGGKPFEVLLQRPFEGHE